MSTWSDCFHAREAAWNWARVASATLRWVRSRPAWIIWDWSGVSCLCNLHRDDHLQKGGRELSALLGNEDILNHQVEPLASWVSLSKFIMLNDSFQLDKYDFIHLFLQIYEVWDVDKKDGPLVTWVAEEAWQIWKKGLASLALCIERAMWGGRILENKKLYWQEFVIDLFKGQTVNFFYFFHVENFENVLPLFVKLLWSSWLL